MQKLQFLIMPLAFFVMGCATTHPGNVGKSIKASSPIPIKISAQSVDGSYDDTYQLIDVTIENMSERWVKINSAQVVISNPAELSVIKGEDLRHWSQAMRFKLEKDQHNAEIAQAVILTGGVIAAHSNDSATSAAGSIATLGVLGWAVADAVNFSYRKATQAGAFPENHLYSPFSIPGRLFTRRWVVLNKPLNVEVQKLVIEVETISGEKDVYEFSI